MPHMYGIEHIIYLLISVTIIIASLFIQKKYLTSDKQKTIFIKSIALLLLIFICWNRYAIASRAGNYLLLLPDTFCGTSSMGLALAVLIGKKDNDFLHCICYIGFVGGMLTLFYPDFIGQNESIFYDKTISCFLHHTFMPFLVIAMIQTGYFVPTIKRWKCAVCGGAFYIIYGLSLISILGFSNSMEIMKPILDGTNLYWYAIGGIFLVVYFIGMFIFEKCKKIKASKVSIKEED